MAEMSEDTSDVIALEIASLIWLDTKHVMSHFLIHVWRGSAFFLPYNRTSIYIDQNQSQNINVLLSATTSRFQTFRTYIDRNTTPIFAKELLFNAIIRIYLPVRLLNQNENFDPVDRHYANGVGYQ